MKTSSVRYSRIANGIILLIGAVSAVMVILTIHAKGLTGDPAWQLATGHWMVVHHQVVKTDHWSRTVRGRPWTDLEWGWSWWVAWLVQWGGYRAEFAWDLLCVWGGWWGIRTLWMTLVPRREVAEWGSTFSLASMSVLTLFFVGSRPYGWDLLIWPWAMVWMIHSRNRSWVMWLGIPVFVLWENMHGSFLLIWVLWGVQIVTALWMDRPHLGRWLAFGGALALASGLTPWGWHTSTYAIWLVRNPWIHTISEWQPPNTHKFLWFLMVSIPWIGIFGGIGSRWLTIRDWRPVILTLGVFAESLLSERNFVFLLPPLIWWIIDGWNGPSGMWTLFPVIRRRWGLPVSFVAIWGIIGWWGLPQHPTQWAEQGMPMPAIQWLQTHPHPGLFNQNLYGGDLIWAGIAPFKDGRMDLYAKDRPQVIRAYDTIISATGSVKATLQHWRIQTIWVDTHDPLDMWLATQPQWHQVWHGSTIEIWRKR